MAAYVYVSIYPNQFQPNNLLKIWLFYLLYWAEKKYIRAPSMPVKNFIFTRWVLFDLKKKRRCETNSICLLWPKSKMCCNQMVYFFHSRHWKCETNHCVSPQVQYFLEVFLSTCSIFFSHTVNSTLHVSGILFAYVSAHDISTGNISNKKHSLSLSPHVSSDTTLN